MYRYGGMLQLTDRHSAKSKHLLLQSALTHVGPLCTSTQCH